MSTPSDEQSGNFAATYDPVHSVPSGVLGGASAPQEQQPVGETGPKTPDERKQLLARTIQTQVASGARVESQSDFQAVVVNGHRVNHLLHLILTLVTFGLWGIVWLVIALTGGEKRSMLLVDEYGNVAVQRL